MVKICFIAGLHTKKEWQKRRRQLYKCHDCGRQFVGGKRLDTQDIIKDYVEGKQTLAQLAEKYGVNKSTIWRRIGCTRSIRVISGTRMWWSIWIRLIGGAALGWWWSAMRSATRFCGTNLSEWDRGRLPRGCRLASGQRLHDPWHSLRRPWRAVFRFGKVPCADVPVPSGDDCAPLPYIKARTACGHWTYGHHQHACTPTKKAS